MPQARQFPENRFLIMREAVCGSGGGGKQRTSSGQAGGRTFDCPGILNGCNYITIQSCIFLARVTADKKSLGVRLM